MIETNKSANEMWSHFLACIQETPDTTQKVFDTCSFGDTKEMADTLAQLVMSGKKIATTSLYFIYEVEEENLPHVGSYSVILDGEQRAQCITQLSDVSIMPFSQVTEDYAKAEGEGDLTLAYWKKAHQAFFTRELCAYHKQWSDDLLVVCERFHVVYRKPTSKGSQV